MEQLRRGDRSAFTELVYDHFRRLDQEAESWEQTRRQLEASINDGNYILCQKDDRIRELEAELLESHKLVDEYRTAENAKQQRSLRAVTARAIGNKENAPNEKAVRLHSLEEETPAERLHDQQTHASFSERLVQTDDDVGCNHCANYGELQLKHDELRMEHDKLADAHRKLLTKYKQNKEIWKRWTERDNKRREQESTKKRGRGDDLRGQTASPGLMTPTPPEAAAPKPPFISPMKSTVMPQFNDAPIKKGGLFSQLKDPIPVRPDSFSGKVHKSIPAWGNTPAPTRASVDSTPPNRPCGVEIPRASESADPPSLTTSGGSDGERTTPAGNVENEGVATQRTNSKFMEPPPIPTAKAAIKRQHEGSSPSRPVVVKSEPPSSQDYGYHVFDEESIDLDEVSDRPEPPKKKSKHSPTRSKDASPSQLAREASEVGNDRGDIVPIGTGADVWVAGSEEPEAKADALSQAKVQRMTIVTEEPNQDRKPCPPPEAPQHRQLQSTMKSPTKRSSKRYRDALVGVLEDGTDGETNIDKNTEVPNVPTNVTLETILKTPAPKDPSLKPLARDALNARSAPARKQPWGGDGFETPSNKPSDRERRHAATNPQPQKKNYAADVRARQTDRQRPAPPPQDRSIGLGDFCINPAMNDGRTYAYGETIRRKEDRRCLPGCTKACCADLGKFVRAAGLPQAPKGPRWRSSPPEHHDDRDERDNHEGRDEFIERYGRHRDAFPRSGSPPGFWDSEFPNTPQRQKHHEEAGRRERERAEHMRREAEKGERGRFMYR